MAEQQKKAKTTKRRRGNSLRWLQNKDRNMLRRAKAVYRRYARYAKRVGERRAHLVEIARAEAQSCASHHGVVVEAALSRWLQAGAIG